MKECYVTIKIANKELSGRSDELSKWITLYDFINMVSQPAFFTLTIQVSKDPVIPDHEITLMKV